MKKFFLSILIILLAIQFNYSQENDSSRKQLENLVKEAYQTFQPTGLAVAVIKNGEVRYYTHGIRSSETNEPVTKKSVFNIASCTKAFTAVSLSILVNEGKVSWDDKVKDYIPEFNLKDPYVTRELNLADILSHRSGLTTFTGDLLWYHTDYSNEEVMRRMRFLPVENDFREDFGYQNNMYMLAGEIIEKVTGKTWAEFVKERILKPLEMKNTTPSNDEITPDIEVAYPHLNGDQVSLYDFTATKPAASIHSSVEDLSLWVQMLLNKGNYGGKEIIEEAAIDDCFKPQTLLNVSKQQKEQGIHFRGYGFGWSMYDYHSAKIIEHNGGMPGYISKITLIPEENLGFVILNNGFEVFVHNALKQEIIDFYLNETDRDWIEKFAKEKENYIEKKKEKDTKRINSRVENTSPALSLNKYTGEYKDKMYGNAKIQKIGEEISLTLEPAGEIFTSPMSHWHYDTFRIDFKDPFLPFGLVTFDFDSDGNVVGFKIDLPINDFHFNNLYFKKL